MREWSKVAPALWDSRRFKKLPSDTDRFLFLYLLTNKHQSSAGCYCLPDGYAATDLAWAKEEYAARLIVLEAGGVIRYDSGTSEILIERWFKHNPPMNEKHHKGTCTLVERIQSSVLREHATNELRLAWEQHLTKSAAHLTKKSGTVQQFDRLAALRARG